MRLQNKILLALISVSFLTLVLHWVATRSSMSAGMTSLNRESADSVLRRAKLALTEESEELDLLCGIFAADPAWVSLLDGKEQAPAQKRLERAFFDKYELNLIHLYGNDGRLVAGAAYKASEEMPIEGRDWLIGEISDRHPLAAIQASQSRVKGLMITRIDPMIVASHPVDCDGAWCGSLMIGRFFDRQKEKELGRIIEADLRMIQHTETLPAHLPGDIWSNMPSKSPLMFLQEKTRSMLAYHGTPALNHDADILIETSTKDPFWEKGQAGLSAFLTYAVVIGLTGLAAFILFFQKVVVKPIKVLTGQVLSIGDSPDREIQGLDRHDEIGVLAKEFNRLLDRLKHRSDQESGFSELDSLLAACNSIEEAAEVFPRIAQALFPGVTGALYIATSSLQVFEFMVGWGGEWTDKSVYSFTDCWALRRGRAHTIRPGGSSPLCGHLSGEPTSPRVCIPLMAQGETMGVLHFKATEGGAMDPGLMKLAETLAQHTGLAIANLKLRERLHNQAVRDPLTGLYNRRFLEESLERELSRARREKAPLAVMMMDLDHFKTFNDTHGHEAGDYVLKQLGLTLDHFVRREDIACRYGGEEFTLILPGANLETGLARAASLCERVRSIPLRFHGEDLGRVTLSVGVALYPDHGESGEGLLAAADRALYRAKAEGRDRAVPVDWQSPPGCVPPEDGA